MDTSCEDSAEHLPIFGIPSHPKDSREPHEKQRSVYFVLASTLFERLAFYTLAANIALNLKATNDVIGQYALLISFLFEGISNFSSIIFAIISDARLGRGKTILIGFSLYLIGYSSAVGYTSIQYPNCTAVIFNSTQSASDTHLCRGWLLSTLILISIGSGAVQANMSVFGSEQIQTATLKSRFFDYYLLVVNIGGIVSTIVIRTIYNNSHASHSPYFIPSIIAASAIWISAILFVIGWKYYFHDNLRETVVINCIPVIINAFQARRRYERESSKVQSQQIASEPSTMLNASQSSSDDGHRRIPIDNRPEKFLDFAKVPYGKFHDRIVNDVKSLQGIMLVFTLLIPYWVIWSQLSSVFPLQALHMKNATDTNIVFMWLGDPATVIIGILVMNLFIYKYIDVSHRSSIMVNKFIFGMFFAFCTAVIAGGVEIARQNSWQSGQNSSDLHFCFTLPQNIFLGISEIFAVLGSYEYSYFASPRSGLSLFMSLRFFSLGVSSFIAAGYLSVFGVIVNGTLDFTTRPDSNNKWAYYTYFFVLAGIQLIFLFIFILCQKKYQILKLNPQQIRKN